MAGRGTKLRPIRVPEDLYLRILAEIRRTNPNRFDEAFNFSSWMLTAAREKLDLAYRRRTSRAKRRARLQGKQQPPRTDQVDGFDQVARSLGFEPIGEGFVVTESVVTQQQLQFERQLDEGEV